MVSSKSEVEKVSSAASMEVSTSRYPQMQSNADSITHSSVLAQAGHWPEMGNMTGPAVSVVKAVHAVLAVMTAWAVAGTLTAGGFAVPVRAAEAEHAVAGDDLMNGD